MVVNWLEDEGLGQYTDVCSNHIKSGDDLVKMTSADLEKVLGIKKMLHRKKINLALQVGKSGSIIVVVNQVIQVRNRLCQSQTY